MGMAAAIPLYTVDDLEDFPRDGNRYELLDGVLLVTPAPNPPHEFVISRLVASLVSGVQLPGHAVVMTRGAVSFPPRTQLEPDILVIPARAAVPREWTETRDYWLAVEVYSPGSRFYDREYKRDNYHTLGVAEVWLVDLDERCVEVSRAPGAGSVLRDALVWRPPVLDLDVRIDLAPIFSGLE